MAKDERKEWRGRDGRKMDGRNGGMGERWVGERWKEGIDSVPQAMPGTQDYLTMSSPQNVLLVMNQSLGILGLPSSCLGWTRATNKARARGMSKG